MSAVETLIIDYSRKNEELSFYKSFGSKCDLLLILMRLATRRKRSEWFKFLILETPATFLYLEITLKLLRTNENSIIFQKSCKIVNNLCSMAMGT